MVQEHDDVPIEESDARAFLYNCWREDFKKYELSFEQRRKSDNAQNSAFNAYLKNRFGGKRFIFAVWEMGITWGATEEHIIKDPHGATEHVYKGLLQWSYDMSEAIENHKESDCTMEATRRSGGNTGKSGLTPEEVQNRADKRWHIECYEYARESPLLLLHRQ